MTVLNFLHLTDKSPLFFMCIYLLYLSTFANFLLSLLDVNFRDLDARAKNERYRALFRLTPDERLDGHTDCTLWTPFAKMHIVGQLFVSNNYICFCSREEDLCQLIIPLREVPTHTTQARPFLSFSASCLSLSFPMSCLHLSLIFLSLSGNFSLSLSHSVHLFSWVT